MAIRNRTFDTGRPDFAPYGLTCERWLPRRMERANRHNEIELNFLGAGSITYLFGGQRLTVRPGLLTVFWAAIPHQIVAVDGTEAYFVATIPLAWFLQCRLPGQFVERLLRGGSVSEREPIMADFDQRLFSQWLSDMEHPSHRRPRAILLEMEARLLRLAERMNKGPSRPAPIDIGVSIPEKVERMATFIAKNYTERLNVEQIGRKVGLHPNYAMSLFRKTFGTTLIEYLTQLRVSHAQRLLATTGAKVLDVALSSGFSSLSRFNAAFSRICGVPPTEYRRTHRL